ncbi:polysaccharide deacetylase family protein [Heyndrickxia sp. NPDC080065]|uniref:polysaccharide deacetylase family protein n=1 Tax=Heyndrickxia sp. NPDC080065 TaxID=3390568 RepID=UPI003D047287
MKKKMFVFVIITCFLTILLFNQKTANADIVVQNQFKKEAYGSDPWFSIVKNINKGAPVDDKITKAHIPNANIASEKKPKPPIKKEHPKKIAYITIDDGPNNSIDRILSILDKYKAKATFFMLNDNMKYHKNAVKKMTKSGHGLACHGVTHDTNKFYHSPTSAAQEMKTCFATLKKISGKTSVVMRVPYGSKPYMTTPYRKKMDEYGYKMWDWNIDSLDWKWLNGPKTADFTINQIKNMKKAGITPIILLHDKPTTADALPKILKYLKDNGYEMKPLTNDMKPYNFWNLRKI